MSCTVYYKGTLKPEHNPEDVKTVVIKHANELNTVINETDDSLIINFNEGLSESLVFEFKNNKLEENWKWNGNNPDEFYKILDMFFELKPYFKLLRIYDDAGLWNDFSAGKTPCKIKLRKLLPNELKILDRIRANEKSELSGIEKFIMLKTGYEPYNKSLLRIIVQDFIKVLNINSIDEFKPKDIIALANELRFAGKYYVKREIGFSDCSLSHMLLEIWISYFFEFKGKGRVSEIPDELRGFNSSKIAAMCGISSIFLNSHAGGASNSKEAEMIKLAKKYYPTGALGEVMVIDEPERELEMLFSMMDYLGFKYVEFDEENRITE